MTGDMVQKPCGPPAQPGDHRKRLRLRVIGWLLLCGGATFWVNVVLQSRNGNSASAFVCGICALSWTVVGTWRLIRSINRHNF